MRRRTALAVAAAGLATALAGCSDDRDDDDGGGGYGVDGEGYVDAAGFYDVTFAEALADEGLDGAAVAYYADPGLDRVADSDSGRDRETDSADRGSIVVEYASEAGTDAERESELGRVVAALAAAIADVDDFAVDVALIVVRPIGGVDRGEYAVETGWLVDHLAGARSADGVAALAVESTG